MKIEYDPAKNAANIRERNLPFDRVFDLDWDTALIAEDGRMEYGERRYVALGLLDERLHFVCYTWRKNVRRIISFRKANKREEKIYDSFNG